LNCCWIAFGIDSFAGEILSELNAVTTAEPFIEFSEAAIVATPPAAIVERPRLPVVLLTGTAAAFVELQAADCVTSCCVPLENVAVAVNCCGCPATKR